jgi:hypothetical protein
MAETLVPSAQLLGLSLRNSDWLTANSPLQRFSASASFTAKELEDRRWCTPSTLNR